MKKKAVRVAVTGGAGHIAYSLLFRIANGEMFGLDQPIILSILELPQSLQKLEGVKMELQDSAFPLLKEVRISADPNEGFEGAQFALLIGAKPRGPGMERGDLLKDNGKIFVEQGKALNTSADSNVKVLVVGNPCNTNALIAMRNAPKIPKENFHAMTRLDQNRAAFQLAQKSGCSIEEVTQMTIWGNHSSTQVPDFVNAKIQGKPAKEVIKDAAWFESTFLPTVQKRGAAIIEARGVSSAASAANAVVNAVKALVTPTPKGEWFSSGVCSDGNPYGVEENLIFSFPCRSKGDGTHEIVSDVVWDDFLKKKIQATEKELVEEREAVGQMLPNSEVKSRAR